MPGEVKVNFDEVYSQTSSLRNKLTEGLESLNTSYANVDSKLDELDGSANASLKTAMESNRKKSQDVAMTLQKMINFMENSSRSVQESDIEHSNTFRAGSAGHTTL